MALSPPPGPPPTGPSPRRPTSARRYITSTSPAPGARPLDSLEVRTGARFSHGANLRIVTVGFRVEIAPRGPFRDARRLPSTRL
jgi:hypothetical protein